MERSFITSRDGGELAVYEAGNAQGWECLFIHGFAMDHSVWRRQFTDPLLLSRCRLLAVDLRGHGRSCRSALPGDYLKGETWAADLAAVIRGRNLVHPVLVPWSFGGRVVNDYLRYFGAAGIAGINYVAAASISDADVTRPDHELLHRICAEASSGEERRQVLEECLGKMFRLERGEEEFQRLYAVIRAMPRRTLRCLRRRPLDYDDVLAVLELPVLSTHGAGDCMLDPEMSLRLARRVRNGRASIYGDAGHAPFFDQPGRFNRELLEFVSICTDQESDKSQVISD
ncbi:MAG: alpha/beta hydrolase [Gammaproteobacteria bacterium]